MQIIKGFDFLKVACCLVGALALPAMSEIVEPKIIERGPHHRVWETVTEEVKDNGEIFLRTNSFTELANGMHFFKDGQWRETKTEFQILPNAGGATAQEGPHQVTLLPNINSPGAVSLQTPDGKHLLSTPMGLGFFDPLTGQSVLVAGIKDCIGELVAPNVVLYPDAFDTDVKAALRYTYTQAGFEQDVIIYDKAGLDPSEYGLDPNSSRLEIWTEFFDPPLPEKKSQILADGAEDEALDFGVMKIGRGKAFALENVEDSIAVSKNWLLLEGRNFLVEGVSYQGILPVLDSLQARVPGLNQQVKRLAQRKPVKSRNAVVAMGETNLRDRKKAGQMASIRPGQMIRQPGLVLDYTTININKTNFTFAGDVTYYISATVYLGGTNTSFEGGSVLKFSPTNTAKLQVASPITWSGQLYRPVVISARDDHTVGEAIGSAALSGYYANIALDIDANAAGTNFVLQHLRISHAQTALTLSGKTGHVISHAQFVNCQTGIKPTSAEFSLRNALFYNVLTNFNASSATGHCEHVTIDTAIWMNHNSTCALNFTNSLLVAVTNLGSYEGQSNATNGDPASVFKAVGGGSHYLLNDDYRTGTTNINAELREALKGMTTYPPIEITNNITSNTNLSAQATRDTDSNLDLGWHYPPLDWVAGGKTLSATLVLTNAAVLGAYGAWYSYGLSIVSSGKLFSEGTPTAHTLVVRYNTSQEQARTNWSASSAGSSINLASTSAQARFRFTTWSLLAGVGSHFNTAALATTPPAFRDCQLRGGRFTIGDCSVALTNCLWERVYVDLDDDGDDNTWYLYNNLFRLGTLHYKIIGTPLAVAQDNLFDQTVISAPGSSEDFSHIYNGYVTNQSRLTPNGTGDVILTNTPVYQTGSLGQFYYPTNDGMLSTLINTGSRYATNAGLAHFTLTTNQVKDTSWVDIGWHVVAVTNGLPIDSDLDGIPDYIEDPNGNGQFDSGETCLGSPVITLSSGTLQYLRGAAPTLVTTSATLTDPDSPNFSGGQLTIEFASSGGLPGDVISIRDQGTNSGQIGLTGNTNDWVSYTDPDNTNNTMTLLERAPLVTYQGIVIGTNSGGTNAQALLVTFNTNATPERIAALLTNITYQYLSTQLPPTTTRLLNFSMTDGPAGTSCASPVAAKSITINCAEAVEAVLIIDKSKSTIGETLARERLAAQLLLTYLRFPTDKVGVITFCGKDLNDGHGEPNGYDPQTNYISVPNPERMTSITDDYPVTFDAIGAITNVCDGTDYHHSLNWGISDLLPASSSLKLIVLLTDGGLFPAKQELADLSLTNAAYARAQNIRVVTIGFGDDVLATDRVAHRALLRNMASSPGDFYLTDLDSLTNAYSSIARSLCRELPNQAPTISIVTPTNNTVMTEITNIAISATVTNGLGTVTNVQFYHKTTLLGSTNSVGASNLYYFTWTNRTVGRYPITAKATDDLGLTAVSPITLVRVQSTNAAPEVWITYPTHNQEFHANADITITASVTAGDGTVTNVEFFADERSLGNDPDSPYSITECCWESGTYQLTAKVTDTLGFSSISTQINIVVAEQVPTSGEGFWDPIFTIPVSTERVNCTATHGSTLYCGVSFPDEWDGIYKWDGTNWLGWDAFECGVTESIVAMAANESGVYYADINDNGVFMRRKDGEDVHLVGENSSLSVGANFYDFTRPLCLKFIGPDLYLGGDFIGTTNGLTNALFLAKWNPTAETWDGVGNGLNGPVFAIDSFDGDLVVGGRFDVAGTYTNVHNLARLQGGVWTPLGGGVQGINSLGSESGIQSLAACGNILFVGGDFTTAGELTNVNSIALWNGEEWQAMSQGVGAIPAQEEEFYSFASPVVLNLLARGNTVFVSGKFTAIWDQDGDNVSVSGIAKAVWDEATRLWTWSDLDLGAFDSNYAPGAYSGDLVSMVLMESTNASVYDVVVGGFLSFAGSGRTNLLLESALPTYQNLARWSVGKGPLTNAPLVSISSPTNYAVFTNSPSTINVTAITVSTAAVAYVDFYSDGSIFCTDSTLGTNSHMCIWTNPAPGLHQLKAVAVDTNGIQGESKPILLSIESLTNTVVARDDSFTIPENSPAVVLPVLTNDSSATALYISRLLQLHNSLGTTTIGHDGTYITFNPFPHLFGTHRFAYTVTNSSGASDSAWATVNIRAQPTIQLTAPHDKDRFKTNTSVTISGTTRDWDGSVSSVKLYTNGVQYGSPITPYANGTFTNSWIHNTNGFFTIEAVAVDDEGYTNLSTPITIVLTNATASPNPPVAVISNLVSTAIDLDAFESGTLPTIQEGLFNLQGRATDPDVADTVSYAVLLFRPEDEDMGIGLSLAEVIEITNPYADVTPGPLNYQRFHIGGVTNGDLGTLDLTAVPNGIYDLVLRVRGGTDETNAIVRVQIGSALKVGQFSFSEQDLVIPVNGIPLTVIRTYNSLNTVEGDFGFNWAYSINDLDVTIDEQRETVTAATTFEEDDPLDDTPIQFSLRTGGGRNITLTMPDGQRTTFAYTPRLGGNRAFAEWTAPPGVHSMLSMNLDKQIFFQPKLHFSAGFGATPYEAYDVPSWTLETPDGTQYEITRDLPGETSPSYYYFDNSGLFGPTGNRYEIQPHPNKPRLSRIIQRSGDTIEINPATILHKNATGAVTRTLYFERDAKNRITEIRDPIAGSNGVPVVKYVYNQDTGNLIRVLRLVDRTTGSYTTNSYHYDNPNFPHYITSIENADGVPVARNNYDDAGKLISVQDADGNLTQFVHNLTNNMEVVIDRLNQTNVFVYDTRGNVTATTNALGQVKLMGYDENNNKTNEVVFADGQPYATNNFVFDGNSMLLFTTDPLGHSNTFAYNGHNQVTISTDARGNSTTNVYDDSTGNLLGISDALGNTTTNFYSNGLLIGSRDAAGTLTTNYFDSLGNLTASSTLSASGAILSTNSFAYDLNGNRTNSTIWRKVSGSWTAATTTYILDAQNRTVQTIEPDGGTNTVVYNAIGKQQSTIDKLGRTTSYTYDDKGWLIQTMYPDLTTETSAFDSMGNRTNSVDRASRVTTYLFDALNRLTETIYPDSTSTRTIYDDLGRVKFSVDARGTTNAFGYDLASRRVSTTNAVGADVQMVSAFGFDASGNQIYFTNALGVVTTNVFDALNRQAQTLYPNGTKMSTAFDAAGRRVAETNQDGIVTLFGYDGVGRLTSVTNTLNKVTRYEYDEAGNQTAQIDALNRTNRFEFDSMGRRTKHVLPGNQTETFGYDFVGNLIRDTNFNGVVITNQHDILNRLTNRSSINGYNVSYAYSVTGQRTNMTDTSGATAYAYDVRNRLTNCASLAGELRYRYDAGGNLTNISSSTANGTLITYQYDSLNRLTNVVDGRLTGTQNTSYRFDAVGNLQGYTYPNGVTNLYQYNSLNRLTNLAWKLNTTALSDFSYKVGLAGNRTNLNETVNGVSQTNRWSYDSIYRLTNEVLLATSGSGTNTYTYDDMGNRLTRTVTGFNTVTNQTLNFDKGDRLDNDGDSSTASTWFDANGNTTNYAGTFQYDVENRLTNANNGAVVIVYNGDGQRVKKVAGGVTTFYLVDMHNPSGYAQVVEELTVSGTTNLSRAYTWGLSLISQRQPGVVTNFYGLDGHGSVRFLLNPAGNITDSYTYDAYGMLLVSTGTTANNYRYACQWLDSNLGLYDNRARWMNPDIGRFQTADTWSGNKNDPPSLHRYTYAADDPVNNSDPSGHETLTEVLTTAFVQNILVGFVLPAVVEHGAGKALAGVIPNYVKEGLETIPTPDAVMIGVSGSISGPLGKTPFGVTGVGGFDVLWSPHTAAIAAYGFLGGGVTFGRTALAGSGQAAFGMVFSCPDSQQYAGEFLTVSIPYKRLSPKIRDKVNPVIDNAAGYIANILSGPVNSNGDLSNITRAVSASGVLDKSSVNVFWNRKGGSFGISFGYGVAPKTATSNVSIVGSYYWQLSPEDDTPAGFQ